MIDVKVHEKGVISLCDSNLLGRTLLDEDVEVKLSEHFYKGEHLGKELLEEYIKEAKNINAVGEESISLLLKLNIIVKENIKIVNKVPMVLVFQV